MAYICKQPNGLYCIFSSVTDCPTHWNMTEEDYINMRMERAKEDAIDTLQNYTQAFERVTEDFVPDNNMTQEEFNIFLDEVNTDPARARRTSL